MVFLAAGRLAAVFAAGLPAEVVAVRAADLEADFAPLSATLTIGNLAGAAAGFLAAAVLAGALFAAVFAGAALTGPRVEVLRLAGLAASLRV